MRFFDAAATRAAIPMGELLDAVEAAYRSVAAGRDRSPLRSRVPLGDGDLLTMPGASDDVSGATVKVVTVMPANAALGLPTVHAVVLWVDATTGEVRAAFDGATITAMRTGAASGVATRLLARRDAHVLTLFGAGAQAAWQAVAVCAVRPIDEVRVVAREPAHRDPFAARLAEDLGSAISVRAMDDPEAAVRGAHVICAATTSSVPVFQAGWLEPGAHVNGIGAYRPGMVELPPALFGAASLVAVDERRAALAEAGDVLAAIEAGGVTAEGLVEIGTIGRDWVLGRDPDALTVFKSVGLAAQDLAATEIAARRLLDT